MTACDESITARDQHSWYQAEPLTDHSCHERFICAVCGRTELISATDRAALERLRQKYLGKGK